MTKNSEKIIRWNLSGLVGLEQNQVELTRLLMSERMHPVVLLEGREGLGKRHLAVWMAANVLCESEAKSTVDGRPCGICPSCRDVLIDSHPDLFILDGENGTIKTADVELLQSHFDVLSASGRRVGLILNADRLTLEAANRLLKTLEEPPVQARIFLTTSRPLSLPATVLGRCLRWRLRLPSREDVIKWTQQKLAQAGHKVNDQQMVENLARELGYSPGKISKRILSDEGLVNDLAESVASLLKSESLSDVLHWASDIARVKKAKVSDVLNFMELELSTIYREKLLGESYSGDEAEESWLLRKRLRDALRTARQKAVMKKIALNAQLVSESLGLSRWKEGV